MDHTDFYQLLEVKKSASASEIKTVYRKLARKYHPDLHPNDSAAEKRFKEINEANEILSEPDKRKKYDQHGDDWKHAEEFKKARKQKEHPSGNSSEQFAGEDFSDLFGSMFGGRANHGHQSKFRGTDLIAELHLHLNNVYKFSSRHIL